VIYDYIRLELEEPPTTQTDEPAQSGSSNQTDDGLAQSDVTDPIDNATYPGPSAQSGSSGGCFITVTS
jgi:hypothetical protein